ncbi:hypothetical protein Agub_g16037, partial [Astrephomene gubernaculifera]
MEVVAPYASWALGLLSQLSQQASPASVAATSAPVVKTAIPSPMSLGLKILLEPTAGGLVFRAASNTLAIVYPVYASAKAIESEGSADDVQWLTYWTLYGSIILAEHVADKVLGRVPYYYHAKFAALLWLQLPQTRGATYLYTRYYKPALARYGPRIDAVLARGQQLLSLLYSTYRLPLEASLA